MKAKDIIAPLIILYCGWNAKGLLFAWAYSPMEAFSWLAFLIWCLPLLYWIAYCLPALEISSICLGSALLFSLMGNLGSVNTLHYFALSLALASVAPQKMTTWVWMTGSISWMPLLGWLGSHHFPHFIIATKLLIAVAATTAMALGLINLRGENIQ